jgi:hypothetical protein
MSLQGSIANLQEALAKLYLDLEQRFNDNLIIRDLWNAMAHDITQQKRSMSLLPNSFWNKLKDQKDGFSASFSDIMRQRFDNEGDRSLKSCFERALLFEEPAISKIYIPIIRSLRENWTEQSLDFYIMVKAHLARIARVTQSFAGDPMIIQRASLLLRHFEKEVQEPKVIVKPAVHKGKIARPIQTKEKRHAKPKKKSPPKPTPSLAKRANSRRAGTKPLVKKIGLQRRRVRR